MEMARPSGAQFPVFTAESLSWNSSKRQNPNRRARRDRRGRWRINERQKWKTLRNVVRRVFESESCGIRGQIDRCLAMKVEVITKRDDLLIRRMILEPGESMPWHTDLCHRFTVVIRGDSLGIEFRKTGEIKKYPVHAGMTDWDKPYLEAVPNPRGFGWKPDTDINLRHVM